MFRKSVYEPYVMENKVWNKFQNYVKDYSYYIYNIKKYMIMKSH